MYIINNNLSKEENIELASKYEEKAKDLLSRFDSIISEANKEYPGRTFGLSKSKLEKHKSPNEAYSRVYSAANRSLYYTKSHYETIERAERQKIKDQEELDRKRKIEEEKSSLVNDAISYCLENGRIFNQDGLNVDSSISIANEIAYRKEIEKRESEIGEGYISFDGQNCEDECAGWNPKDRRCECGNRRVSWTDGYYFDFRSPLIHAEAY